MDSQTESLDWEARFLLLFFLLPHYMSIRTVCIADDRFVRRTVQGNGMG